MSISTSNVRSRQTWAMRNLWHLPAAVVLGVYLPAALLGMYAFRDAYAASFLALLAIFAASYYLLYSRFSQLFANAALRSGLWRIGDRIDWRLCAGAAALAYVAAIGIAAYTTQVTPVGAALRGASLMEIAEARGEFLAKREGVAALLRYAVVILGRSVLPFLVAYAYWSEHRLRHVALIALLACYGVALEKASPLFVFLPLILLRSAQWRWRAAALHVAGMVACTALFTFLAMGGLYSLKPPKPASEQPPVVALLEDTPVRAESVVPRHGDPKRHYVFHVAQQLDLWPFSWQPEPDGAQSPKLRMTLWMTNRIVWVPYITAYDWLKFQDDVLGGRLTHGRSIGVVAWLMGEPRLQLEQQVYAYQFGESPGGAGASNTVFFVDAKLAFGWLGAIVYCLIFPLFAAAIFSSKNEVAKVASVTSFFTASVSPLTATLLSGGLAFYVAIALLARLERNPTAAPRAPGDAHDSSSVTAH